MRQGRTFPVRRVDHAGVDGPEGGRGEGGEHGRVPGDDGGDAFAADEAGFDELVGVGPVGLRTRWADGGAAVAAGHVEHAVGQVGGVPGVDDPAGGLFDGVQVAGEPDGADAAAGGGGVGEPAAEVGGAGAAQQLALVQRQVRVRWVWSWAATRGWPGSRCRSSRGRSASARARTVATSAGVRPVVQPVRSPSKRMCASIAHSGSTTWTARVSPKRARWAARPYTIWRAVRV